MMGELIASTDLLILFLIVILEEIDESKSRDKAFIIDSLLI
jgi:hypothetical protein